jgi:hypothetical protein
MASIKLKDYLESLSIKGTISANDLVPILDSEASNVLKTSTQSTLVDAASAAIADITAYTASLEGALEIDGTDVTILGNLNVRGTQTIIDSTTINLGDNIIQLNGTFNANGGIYVSDTTSGNTTGSFIWDGVTDSWKAGTIGAEIEVVTLSDSQILTNKTINGSQLVDTSVANGKLTNSSITIAGIATSLGGTITAPTIGNAIGAFSGSIQINHDATTNFVSDEHIAHSGVSITAGNGLTGGGDITTTRTLNVVSANNGIVANTDNIELDVASSTFVDGVKSKLNSETVVSGSVQINHDATTNFVANEHIDHSGVTITAGNGLTGGGTIEATRTINVVSANNGIVANVDNIQLNTASSTFVDGVKSKLNSETVVSGSSQIDHDSTTNFVANEHIDHSGVTITAGNGLTGGGDITTNRTINVVSANNGIVANADNIQLDVASSTFTDGVKSKLNSETVVSGSSQIDVTATTNYSTISSHISSTSNPHGVDATDVGLGNVTNESKATMFASPTFTGTVAGVTATHVGLGNVDNTSDANKPVSTAQQTALNSKLNIEGSNVVSSSAQVVTSLLNQSVDFGTGDITASSFFIDGDTRTTGVHFANGLQHDGDGGTGIYFATDIVEVRTQNNPSLQVDSSGNTNVLFDLDVSGNISGSNVSINDILTISPRTTTPINPISGSFIVSGSGATIKPFFWDGNQWQEMAFV